MKDQDKKWINLCQRGEPSAGQTSKLPDFILNAAKRARILVYIHMYA